MNLKITEGDLGATVRSRKGRPEWDRGREVRSPAGLAAWHPGARCLPAGVPWPWDVACVLRGCGHHALEWPGLRKTERC